MPRNIQFPRDRRPAGHQVRTGAPEHRQSGFAHAANYINLAAGLVSLLGASPQLPHEANPPRQPAAVSPCDSRPGHAMRGDHDVLVFETADGKPFSVRFPKEGAKQ